MYKYKNYRGKTSKSQVTIDASVYYIDFNPSPQIPILTTLTKNPLKNIQREVENFQQCFLSRHTQEISFEPYLNLVMRNLQAFTLGKNLRATN